MTVLFEIYWGLTHVGQLSIRLVINTMSSTNLRRLRISPSIFLLISLTKSPNFNTYALNNLGQTISPSRIFCIHRGLKHAVECLKIFSTYRHSEMRNNLFSVLLHPIKHLPIIDEHVNERFIILVLSMHILMIFR